MSSFWAFQKTFLFAWIILMSVAIVLAFLSYESLIVGFLFGASIMAGASWALSHNLDLQEKVK